MRKTFFIIGVLSLVFLSWVRVIQAQSHPFDIGFTPPVTYLRLKPGQTHKQTLVLTQKGTLPLAITLKAVDFLPNGNTGQPTLTDASTFPYLTLLNPNEKMGQPFSLAPGSSKNLSFEFAIPSDAEEREYHLSVVAEAKPDQNLTAAEVSSQVSGAIASNLIILVSNADHLPTKLEIEKVEAPVLIDSFSPIAFQIKLHNPNLQAVPATGSAQVINWQKQVVAKWEFFPDMILGRNSRLVRALIEPGASEMPVVDPENPNSPVPEPGQFTYDQTFLFGPYDILISVTNPSKIEELRVRVIAFPFVLVGLLVVGSFLYGLARYFATRNHIALPQEKA